MNKGIAIVIGVAAIGWAAQAEDTRTGIFNERIKSLEVHLEGDALSPPVIILSVGDRIEIGFDHLAEEREYLRYELVHCNANWQPSQLVDTEFLNGFNQGNIDDYDYSQLTTTHYVHYWLTIPNDEVAPKVSGNYLLRIYEESDPEDTWLQCRFYVTEQTADIAASMTTRTDIDFNKTHQQLSITVNSEHSSVQDPFNDLTVVVQQNGRWDNEVTVHQPLRMSGRSVSVYEHLRPLIFDGGNEYRRMETVSVHYPGMGVEELSYHEPYYHARLMVDEPRNEDMYLYDETQHGRFTIREYNSDQSDIEADYVVVHFALDMPEKAGGMVFLDGDFTQRRFDPNSLMVYNRATGRYERNMLLKQGAYNYQYLWVPNGSNQGQTSVVEGDKYQTRNEYLIKVYARNPLDRYDRLIGVTMLSD
ncbi:MAG: DUF5103 domain-containing protein [Bacteroidales bacterium]|nr:DUF5103 domain-containing protein [Bacteroidales bacterium]